MTRPLRRIMRALILILVLSLSAGGITWGIAQLLVVPELSAMQESLASLQAAIEKADSSCRAACEESSDFSSCYDRCWSGDSYPAEPLEWEAQFAPTCGGNE